MTKLATIMKLPSGVWGEATAAKVREGLMDMMFQSQTDIGIERMPTCDMNPKQWNAVRQRIDEMCAEQATGTKGMR